MAHNCVHLRLKSSELSVCMALIAVSFSQQRKDACSLKTFCNCAISKLMKCEKKRVLRRFVFSLFAVLFFIAYYPCIHEHSCIGHGRVFESGDLDTSADCPHCFFQQIPCSTSAIQLFQPAFVSLPAEVFPKPECVSVRPVFLPGLPRPPPTAAS